MPQYETNLQNPDNDPDFQRQIMLLPGDDCRSLPERLNLAALQCGIDCYVSGLQMITNNETNSELIFQAGEEQIEKARQKAELMGWTPKLEAWQQEYAGEKAAQASPERLASLSEAELKFVACQWNVTRHLGSSEAEAIETIEATMPAFLTFMDYMLFTEEQKQAVVAGLEEMYTDVDNLPTRLTNLLGNLL